MSEFFTLLKLIRFSHSNKQRKQTHEKPSKEKRKFYVTVIYFWVKSYVTVNCDYQFPFFF